MVDDKPDHADATPEPERPNREPPTLDLEAIEISDETREAEPTDAAPQPVQEQPSRVKPLMTSALVSAIVGATAAALLVWAMGRTDRPQATPPAPAPQTDTAALNTLTARLDRLESRPAAAAPADTAGLDALAARLANVESKAAESKTAAPPPAAAAPDPALPAQIGELEKSVAALREQLAEARAQTDKTAAAVNEVKSTPREIPPPPDLSPLNARIAELDGAVKALSAELAQRKTAPADDPQLRRAVTASLLEVSVRSGEPYAAALAAAKSFASSPDALKPLEPFAASGVPNTNALNRELLALLPKLSPAQETSTTGSGIVDRLQAGAARLVRIERTDAIAGNDRSAIVARVTAAAVRNDVTEARRELKTLAPADRAAAQAWIDKADARDAALAASRQFASEAMATLTRPVQ
jgi:hypothetical protein